MREVIPMDEIQALAPVYCGICGWIAVAEGETYRPNAARDERSVFTWQYCADCQAVAGVAYLWCGGQDNRLNAEDLDRWAREHVDVPGYGPHARAYLARKGGAS